MTVAERRVHVRGWLSEALDQDETLRRALALRLRLDPKDCHGSQVADALLQADTTILLAAFRASALKAKTASPIVWDRVAELLSIVEDCGTFNDRGLCADAEGDDWTTTTVQAEALLELQLAAVAGRPVALRSNPKSQHDAVGEAAQYVADLAITQASIPDTASGQRLQEAVAALCSELTRPDLPKQALRSIAGWEGLRTHDPAEINGQLQARAKAHEQWLQDTLEFGPGGAGPAEPPAWYLVIDASADDRWRTVAKELKRLLPALAIVVRLGREKAQAERELARAVTGLWRLLKESS